MHDLLDSDAIISALLSHALGRVLMRCDSRPQHPTRNKTTRNAEDCEHCARIPECAEANTVVGSAALQVRPNLGKKPVPQQNYADDDGDQTDCSDNERGNCLHGVFRFHGV